MTGMLRAARRLSDEDVVTWKLALDRSVEMSSFFYSVSFFLTVGQKKMSFTRLR